MRSAPHTDCAPVSAGASCTGYIYQGGGSMCVIVYFFFDVAPSDGELLISDSLSNHHDDYLKSLFEVQENFREYEKGKDERKEW